MKKSLLAILAFFIAITANAQVSINVDPGNITGIGPATANDIGAHAQIINTSSDTIRLLWSRTIQSMEHGWASYICDLTNCYLPPVELCPPNRPNILAPGAAFTLEVHVIPAGFDGQADIQIQFFTVEEPSTILGTVQAHFETGTSSIHDPANAALRIYPNPTTSYFQLNDPTKISAVVIHTIVGNKIRQFDARQSNRFDVEDLPEGIYLVRLLDAKQNVLKTVRLSKR